VRATHEELVVRDADDETQPRPGEVGADRAHAGERVERERRER
jgi:hypothetical protein